MGIRFGEEKAIPVPRVRKASKKEAEFLNAGNDRDEEPGDGDKPRAKRRPITKLSDAQIDDATDRVIMGTRLSKIADELNVNCDALAKKIKKRVGMTYMRLWQQSVAFDCLRAEMLLNKSLTAFTEQADVKNGRLALDVLSYRAKVLSFGAVNPQEESTRVAGLSKEELYDAILEKL